VWNAERPTLAVMYSRSRGRATDSSIHRLLSPFFLPTWRQPNPTESAQHETADYFPQIPSGVKGETDAKRLRSLLEHPTPTPNYPGPGTCMNAQLDGIMTAIENGTPPDSLSFSSFKACKIRTCLNPQPSLHSGAAAGPPQPQSQSPHVT
jgi:hypothetical protein